MLQVWQHDDAELITYHGKPVNTKNASATLTMLSATGKTEAIMMPAGSNMQRAKGNFQVDKGMKAVAVVTTNGKAKSVCFVVKSTAGTK